MSYILDALKKLENEKSIKNRGTGMFGISGELFKDERRSRSHNSIWKIAAVIVTASLVTFGVTWFFFRVDKVRHDVMSQSVAPKSQPVRPGPSQAVTGQQPPAPTTSSQAPSPSSPHLAPVHQAVTPVIRVTDAPELTDEQQRAKPHYIKKQQTPLVPQPANSAIVLIPAPSDITISGIAWQDEHNARRAVVNGFLIQEGGSVSGARITEIYQDRVRFSRNGHFFDVYLIASGFPRSAK